MEAQPIDTFARVEATLAAVPRRASSESAPIDDFPPAELVWAIAKDLDADLAFSRTLSDAVFRSVALGPLGAVAGRELPRVAQLVERARGLFDVVRALPALADRVAPFARLVELIEEHEEFFEQLADVRALAAMSTEDREVATDAELA